MNTILVVDDEEKIREVVVSYLRKEGYGIKEAENGEQALSLIKSGAPIDLVILDLMLPDISGEDVCKRIRQISAVPIIMLTAKVAEEHRVEGLTIGADDYVLKPFSPRELVARVKVILRRTNENELLAERISFQNDQLVIDTVKKEVHVNSLPVSLTPNEYKLLTLLARHPQRTFTRDELIEKVLGFDYEGDVRTIDQHIKNLRHKIEEEPKKPRFISTVFGIGYKFLGGAND